MISHIRSKLPVDVLYGQLAEEAIEVAHAAQKLQRILDGRNPTPVTYEQGVEKLFEEIADLFLCMRTLAIPLDPAAYYQTMNAKDHRWSERLSKIPEPGPLTLEEVLEPADGTAASNPVWVELIEPLTAFESGWATFTAAMDPMSCFPHDDWKDHPTVCAWFISEWDNVELLVDGYGKTWNAYRHKPKEA